MLVCILFDDGGRHGQTEFVRGTRGSVIEKMLSLNDKLGSLNKEARSLEKIIGRNIAQIVGEE